MYSCCDGCIEEDGTDYGQNMARRVQSCLDANCGHFQHILRCSHISHTTNVLLFKFRCNIFIGVRNINTLNAELNPICHLLALLGAHLIFHVSRIRVKEMPGSVASGTLCTSLVEITNKMQLCRKIYYSIFPWLFNMFRAILSLIIRSF